MTRAGSALVEVIIASTLLAGVAAGGLAVLQTQTRVARHTTMLSESSDAARSVTLLLRAELEAIAPFYDLRAVGPDSIAARVFRGRGTVCGRHEDRVYVRYQGVRAPDAAKDSMVQIGVETTASFTLAQAEPGVCTAAADEQILALLLNAGARVGSMWLFFESGSFHLHDHALKYRRGSESRQPLTNEVIDVRASSFTLFGDSLARSLRVQLRDRATGRQAVSSIRWLNTK